MIMEMASLLLIYQHLKNNEGTCIELYFLIKMESFYGFYTKNVFNIFHFLKVYFSNKIV